MNQETERAIRNLKKIDEWLKADLTEGRLNSLLSLKVSYTQILDVSLCSNINEYIEISKDELEKRREKALEEYK